MFDPLTMLLIIWQSNFILGSTNIPRFRTERKNLLLQPRCRAYNNNNNNMLRIIVPYTHTHKNTHISPPLNLLFYLFFSFHVADVNAAATEALRTIWMSSTKAAASKTTTTTHVYTIYAILFRQPPTMTGGGDANDRDFPKDL